MYSEWLEGIKEISLQADQTLITTCFNMQTGTTDLSFSWSKKYLSS